MKKRVLQVVAALLCPLVQFAWGDSPYTLVTYPGSFAIDARSPRTIDTKAQLNSIRPIPVDGVDTVIQQRNPNTLLWSDLTPTVAWSASASGKVDWKPTDSGTWQLRNSNTGATANWVVAWKLFHSTDTETGTQSKPYMIRSVAAFKDLVTNVLSNDSSRILDTYYTLDLNWITAKNLYDSYSTIPQATNEAGVVTCEAVDVKWTLEDESSSLFKLSQKATGDTAYPLSTKDVDWTKLTFGANDTFKIDARRRSADNPFEVAQNTTLRPFTFENGQMASVGIYNPNNQKTTYLKGVITRPDKSGEVTWTTPTMGGVYYAVKGGERAYFKVQQTATGAQNDPYVVTSVSAFEALNLTSEGSNNYFTLAPSVTTAQIVQSIPAGTALSLVDEEAGLYTLVNDPRDGTVFLYTTPKETKFRVSAVCENSETTPIAVNSLAEILPIAYCGSGNWGVTGGTSTLTFTVGDETEGEEVETTNWGSYSWTPSSLGTWTVALDASWTNMTAKISIAQGESEIVEKVTVANTESERASDVITAALNEVGRTSATLELSDNVSLDTEEGPIVVPSTIATLTINLAGKEFAGFDGDEDSVAGEALIRIAGTNTVVVIVSTDANGDPLDGGVLRGGDGIDAGDFNLAGSGAKAITFPAGFVGSVTIGEGVTIRGGNGGSSDDSAGAGGARALEFGAETVASLTIGANAQILGGNGGHSTSANGGSGGQAVWVSSISGTTTLTETGKLDITVGENAIVKGGNGGDSGLATAGSGANAIRLPVSELAEAQSELDIAETAVVAGGSAGNAGATGKVGTVGVAVTGSTTLAGEGEVTDGESGQYVVESAEELQMLVDDYAGKTGTAGSTLNIALAENADVTDLAIDAKVEGITVDLNGNNVNSITVSGASEVALSDTAGTKGTVTTVTSGSGSSVKLTDTNVTTVQSTGGSVEVAGTSQVGTVSASGEGSSVSVTGGSVTTVTADEGAAVSVSGGSTVSTVSAGEGTSVDVSGGSTVSTVEANGNTSVNVAGDSTVSTVSSDDSTKSVTVVVEEGATQPATSGEAASSITVASATAVSAANKDSVFEGATSESAYTLYLTEDISDFEIPAGVASVALDLKGYTITGTSGATTAANGTSAITIVGDGAAVITISGTGALVGGNGADGTSSHGAGAEAVSTTGNFTGPQVVVADGITVTDGTDGFGADNMPTVKIVKMQQRYPWNGYVDIDYTLSGNLAGVELVLAYSYDGNALEDATAITVAPTIAEGTWRMTWNAKSDLPANYVSDGVNLTLKLVRKSAE